MRHPDADTIAAECETALPAILEAVGRPPDTDIETDREGWVNLCYFADDLVIRINARDPELPKFRREAHIYERLGAESFPVPEVVLFDEGGRFLDKPVLVTERLPGHNLEADWDELGEDRRRRLARSAGALLGRLHQVAFDGFGEVFGPSVEAWDDWLRRRTRRFLADCDRFDVFETGERQRFREALTCGIDEMAEVGQPRLVHNDYHLGNLLYAGDRITGVVDFEWAFAGDPLWDLDSWPSMDERWPGSRQPFRNGYASTATWPADIEPRRLIYRCLQNLELCIVAERFLSDDEAREFRATTLEGLATLEAEE